MAIFCLTKRELIAQVFSFVLGLASSASPAYTAIITSAVGMLYLLVIIALPSVSPRALLTHTQDQITDMRIWLDDEATTRRSSRMHVITASGLDNLESIEKHVKTLLYRHEKNFTTRNAFCYPLALPKLVIEAHKCQSDIITLRSDLEDEVHALGDS